MREKNNRINLDEVTGGAPSPQENLVPIEPPSDPTTSFRPNRFRPIEINEIELPPADPSPVR